MIYITASQRGVSSGRVVRALYKSTRELECAKKGESTHKIVSEIPSPYDSTDEEG